MGPRRVISVTWRVPAESIRQVLPGLLGRSCRARANLRGAPGGRRWQTPLVHHALPLLCAAALITTACDESSTAPASPKPTAPVHLLVEGPYTTLQAIWAPLVPPDATVAGIDSKQHSVYALDEFEGLGLGVALEDGVPWIDRTELAPDFQKGADGTRRSVTWFWAAADPQVIDEESPIRFEGFQALFRPQGHLMTQTWEAHIRTAARIAGEAARPYDFAIIAGDLTDGSQKNELRWFIDALTGGAIDPDSGLDDDPEPGPGNDYNDPFWSDGIGVRWFATLGNHDGLYNGGFGQLTEEILDASVSGDVYDSGLFDNGFRDGATLGAELRTAGPTPPDPDRRPLRHGELLQALHDAPALGGASPGHGISQDSVDAGEGWFSTLPVPGVPLRLVVVDTSYHTGPLGLGAGGFVSDTQHDWLKAELASATDAGELIIVMTHHRSKDFALGSGATGEEFEETLRSTPNVVLHLTGHGHRNRLRLRLADSEDEPGASTSLAGYWEMMTASTLDFPIQSRIFELVDEGTGYLSIYVTNLDHNSPVGSLAHEARRLAAAKWAFGTVEGVPDIAAEWASELASLNLVLRVAIPPKAAERLADADLSAVITSEATLAKLDTPL